ncbi:MAG: ABC transporter permease [Actinomycetes bacterium]
MTALTYAPTPATSAPAVRTSLAVCARHLRALARQPWYLGFTLVQPVVWLLLFGKLFQRVVDIPGFAAPGASYIAYLTPGVIMMTALFSNGWAGTTFIEDMQRGVLDRMLVSPVRRGSLIAGNLAYQAVTTVLQSVIIVGMALATGARFPGGVVAVSLMVLAALLLGTAFAAYSDVLALLVWQQESLIGAVNFLVLPLSFLSAAFLPEALLPGWVRTIARYNPVNWAVEVGRQSLEPAVDWSVVASRLGLLAALAVVFAALASRAFRSYQDSV